MKETVVRKWKDENEGEEENKESTGEKKRKRQGKIMKNINKQTKENKKKQNQI